MIKKLKVTKNEAGERLDVFLQKNVTGFSRTQIQEAIKKQVILVNRASTKPSYNLKRDDLVLIDFEYFNELTKPIKLVGEKIPLKILLEDEDILVIDKPAGMVVHPAHGNITGTLVNALLDYTPKIVDSRIDDSKYGLIRPGIVHRLDKDTSGLIIVAKNRKSLLSLSRQLANKEIEKNYLALVYGETPKNGLVTSYLGRDKIKRKIITILDQPNGKRAITKYKKIADYSIGKNKISLLLIKIPTGRTHQIRVQMKSIGHPVIGDQTYFSKESKKISDQINVKRQMLHASKIKFLHPTKNKPVKIESGLPEDFQTILDKLLE